jgi:hypothetical protein
MRKIISKERVNGRAKKRYDRARPPFQRLMETNTLDASFQAKLLLLQETLDPLKLHEHLEHLIHMGSENYTTIEDTVG